MKEVTLYAAFDGTVFESPPSAMHHENKLIKHCLWMHHPNKYNKDEIPMDEEHRNWALKWMFENEWHKVKELDPVEMRSMDIDV